MIDNSVNLLDSVLIQYLGHLYLNLFMNDLLDNLNDWLLDDLSFYLDDFVNNRNLDYLLNYFLHCFVLNNRFLDDYLYLFYSLFVKRLLSDYFNFDWPLYYVVNLHNFLYYLWHLHDLLHCLDDRNDFLNYSVYRLVSNLDVVLNVWSHDIFYPLDDFLNDFLYFNNFGNFNSNLNDFLDDSIDWN